MQVINNSMYYIIYETANLINGKLYRGCHQTETLDDGYLGSGKVLCQAISKYGRENFTRAVLHNCNNPEDMFSKEAELVNEDFINRPDTYNLKLGGSGGFDFINQNGLNGRQFQEEAWNKGMKTGPKSKESNIKRSETLKARYKDIPGNRAGCDPWNKGLSGVQDAWNKGIKIPESAKSQCEHCSKVASKGNFTRWHGDNCKHKPV